jgi:lipopolysaccharide transport system ATP-binding protein
LRLLSGVYAPTSGSAIIKGKVGSLIDISLGIDPEATGRENIFLRAALLGMSKTEVADKIEDIIEFTELGNFIDLPLRMYSSGMHMRLAFAVSTVMRPDILLMDEWISVGDEGFKLKAENRLNETVNQTKVLVMASHSKEILEKTCNKILWLEHGSVKMLGETSEVLAQYFKS